MLSVAVYKEKGEKEDKDSKRVNLSGGEATYARKSNTADPECLLKAR